MSPHYISSVVESKDATMLKRVASGSSRVAKSGLCAYGVDDAGETLGL